MPTQILVIDDEEHIRRMMRLALEASGYEVAEARDGPEGLKLFGGGSGFGVVILDQRMPGMDGLEVLRQIKERNGNARIVVATAYASIELAVDAMKSGATDFVRKPMTPETLRSAVAAALIKPLSQPGPLIDTTTSPQPGPLIQTITMNGFTILDDESALALEESHRRFIVLSPDGGQHDVLIEIDTEAIAYVERMTGRKLSPGNSFWTSQAHRVLEDYLWREGKVPPTRRLTIRSVDRDELPIAARWKTN
jgi:CheY-like chemotaxis protein